MRNLIAPVALFAGLMLGSTALAAPAPDSSTTAPGVMASPPVVQRQVLDRTDLIGAPIDRFSASEPVSYADLNLANPADVKTLDHRIDAAAHQTCRAINQQYPSEFSPPVMDGNCVSSAEQNAKESAAALIPSGQ